MIAAVLLQRGGRGGRGRSLSPFDAGGRSPFGDNPRDPTGMLSPEGKIRLQVRAITVCSIFCSVSASIVSSLLYCLWSKHPSCVPRCCRSSILYYNFILQWHRETEVGADMYVATQHTFWETPLTVQVIKGGLVFDPSLQVWVRPRLPGVCVLV